MYRSSSFILTSNSSSAQSSLFKSSSLNNISKIESNQSINLGDLTRVLEEPEFATWIKMYDSKISKTVIKRIFNYRLPMTYVGSSKSNVYCSFNCNYNHLMQVTYRYCCEEPKCTTLYRISYCTKKNVYAIEVKNKHNHSLNKSYNNCTGLDDFWKIKVQELQKARLNGPKAIHNRLTSDYRSICVDEVTARL